MKVLQKLFVVALLLSLILSVGAVSAQDDMTFEQGNLEKNSIETSNNLEVKQDCDDKLSGTETDNEEDVDKLSQTEDGGGQNQLLENNQNAESKKSFSDLQSTINNTNDGDTIYLNGSTYIGSGTPITVNKEIRLIGGFNEGDGIYATLDGQFLSRILTANSQIYISGIIFINGNTARLDGGAVYFNSTGEVTNCNFTNNNAKYGGAISMDSGTVSNCNFTNNNAQYGGAVYFDEQGTVSNCNFTNNTASDWGGAVFFMNTGDVTNCNFTNNTADDGGAVFFMVTGDVTNCNFTNNNAWYGGAVYFDEQGTVSNCNFTNNVASNHGGAVYFNREGDVTNCNFTNNNAGYGGAITMDSGTVTNCNFTNNTASNHGGAVYFNREGDVTNCNFTNNKATADDSWGGAIFMDSGTVSNCNFTNNTASEWGGAVYFRNTGDVTNCNFTDNNADYGSAIYFYKYSSSNTLTISDSIFLDNRAEVDFNTALDVTVNENNITITFVGHNNLLNAIYSRNNAQVTFNNVTYWGADGIATVTSTLSGSNKEAGQNITIGVVVNGEVVFNDVEVTDANGTIVLNIKIDGDYYILAHHNLDSYYTAAQTILTNMSYYVDVTSQTCNNKTVNITAKSNILNEIMQGKLLFILPNSTEISANYGGQGNWWAIYEFNEPGDYKVGASYSLGSVNVSEGTIRILADVPLYVEDMTINFGDVANVVVSVPDAIDGQKIRIIVGSSSKYATVKNGKANASFTDLPTGEYVVVIYYSGDGRNSANMTTAKLTVNKLGSKVTVEPIANITYGDVATIIVTVPEDATGKVFVDTGVAKSYGGIKDGKAIIIIPGLSKGTYTVNAQFQGDSKYGASNGTGSFEVIKDPEYFIKVSMVNGLQLTAVLTDDDKKPVTGAVVFYNLGDGKNVNVTTNDEGEFVCDVQSNSVLTMSYINGNASCSESIIIKNIALTQMGTKIDVPSNMQRTAVDYNAGEKGFDFTFKLLDVNGKPVANKSVKIGIFDKMYTVKTNKDGVGALPINIANANYYTYAVTFLGDDDYKASMGVCSLQIVKKSTTITPAKTSYSFSANAKTKSVTATLKSTNSYIPKGKQVTLTIAGKTFKATIGDKGQINFNIGSITKKGTYKVDIKFAGTNTYAASNSKTITIKIA